MEESTMKKHVSLVAALQIGFSTISIIGALIIFFVFSFAGSFVNDVDEATVILKFIGTFLPAMLILFSLVGLISGIGLLGYQKWSRMLAMVVAAIGCLAFPLGTIVGIYSLWVLMQDESIILFK